MTDWRVASVELGRRTRREPGLPEHVEDGATLARIACILATGPSAAQPIEAVQLLAA